MRGVESWVRIEMDVGTGSGVLKSRLRSVCVFFACKEMCSPSYNIIVNEYNETYVIA